MSNTIFITANWTTGVLSQQTISRQYDNNRYAVQFIGYPEGDGTEELDLYLLVWMSTAPGQKPGEITPIQLNSDQWYISNYFTQQVQVIKFQLCVLNEAGTYEAHSPIFSGRIGDSLEHDGTSHDIDVSTLFDAYREYLNELIIRAGAVVIDSTLTKSGQAADAAAVGAVRNNTMPLTGATPYATVIPENSDLNDYKTPGSYRVANRATARTIANIPTALGGRLTVIGITASSGNFQIYNTTNEAIFVRAFVNETTWNPWHKISWDIGTGDIAELSNAIKLVTDNASYLADNIVSTNAIATAKGVTFTIDGGEVTATGTATGNIVYKIAEITGKERIIYGGSADGGSGNTYFIGLYDETSRLKYVVDSGYKITELDPSKTYSIRLAVLSGVTVDGIVFKPFAYTDGIVPNIEKEVEEVENSLNTIISSTGCYELFNGHCFVTICGDSIVIDAKAVRFYNKFAGTYTTPKTGTVKIANTATNIRYILFDGDNFSLSSTYAPTAIAYAYSRRVTILVDGIHKDFRAIQNGYIRPGSEYYINYDRIPWNVYGDYSETTGIKTGEHAYTYKVAGTYHYSELNGIPVEFTLSENTVSIANKKILMIGDSFVARGFIQNWLADKESSLEFIGTKTTQNYEFKSEGVSGSRLYYFTEEATSPFWYNGGLNFGQYLTANSLSVPDYVVINSAINHGEYSSSTHGTYLQNLKDIVSMIQSYSSNIKIYVTFGANYAMKPGSVYGSPNNRWREVRKCCNAVYDVDGITVVPVDTALVDELDYTYGDYPYFNKTINLLSDCVHPSENTGFHKIANMIYNYLGA